MKTITIKDFIIEVQDELSVEYAGLTIEEILSKITDEMQANGLYIGFTEYDVEYEDDKDED